MNGRALVVVALLMLALPVLGDPPAAKNRVPALIELLGSDDFFEREAATKELGELGVAALLEIRQACLSGDPEVAQRARELATRITCRIENEKSLAPTIVELTADNLSLDTILADLSKQSGYGVVLGGLNVDALAEKKATIRTGKVPFWEAVQKLSDEAGLQIASVGGFTAIGSLPYSPRANAPGVGRVQQMAVDRPPVPVAPGPIAGQLEASKRYTGVPAPSTSNVVVLEARDGTRRRPSAVYGAVCVEAFAPATVATTDAAAVVLQMWPEPKLVWRETRSVTFSRAVDDHAQLLRAVQPPPVQVVQNMRAPVKFVQNVNGVVMIEDGTSSTMNLSSFSPNIRQSLVKFKPTAKVSSVLKEWVGSVQGVIRSPLEAVVSGQLETGKTITATGEAGVLLGATLHPVSDGFLRLEVDLTYEPNAVQPANATDPIAEMKNVTGTGNHTLYGVRVVDENGKPFTMTLQSLISRFDPTGRRISYQMKARLLRAAGTTGDPKTIAFWGSYNKSVFVPFTLRDAPLVPAK